MSVVTPEQDRLNRYFECDKRAMPVRTILFLFFTTLALGLFVILKQSGINPVAYLIQQARLLQSHFHSAFSFNIPRHSLFFLVNIAACLLAFLILRAGGKR